MRILTALDARDGHVRLAPRLVGGDHAVAPERHPPRPALVPGLDDVHLGPRRVDPDAEAREHIT